MGVEVKIEGTKEISKALIDVVSPITEAIGFLGDRVRVYRELSLSRSLKRAHEIAREEGLVLKEPPLKFLVPYMEDCSLEQIEDELLIDMWARLLASASSKFESQHNLFLRILREMTSSEAKLFEYIVSPESHKYYVDYWNIFDTEGEWKDSYVFIKIRDSIDTIKKDLNDDFPFEELEVEFRKIAESPGNLVSHFSVSKGKKGVYPMDDVHNCKRTYFDDNFTLISVAMLKSLGLIGEYVSPKFWFGDYCVEIYAYYTTQLGAHFIKACTRHKISGNRS